MTLSGRIGSNRISTLSARRTRFNTFVPGQETCTRIVPYPRARPVITIIQTIQLSGRRVAIEVIGTSENRSWNNDIRLRILSLGRLSNAREIRNRGLSLVYRLCNSRNCGLGLTGLRRDSRLCRLGLIYGRRNSSLCGLRLTDLLGNPSLCSLRLVDRDLDSAFGRLRLTRL